MFPLLTASRNLNPIRRLYPATLLRTVSSSSSSRLFSPLSASIFAATVRFDSYLRHSSSSAASLNLSIANPPTVTYPMTNSTPLPGTAVIALNDYVSFSNINASNLMKVCPRGAYTTARTYNRTNVFELDTHIQRTSDSIRLMLTSSSTVSPSSDSSPSSSSLSTTVDLSIYEPLLNVEKFRWLMTQSIAKAIQYYTHHEQLQQPPPQSLSDLPKPELKITVLVCWDQNVVPLMHTVTQNILTPPTSIDSFYPLPVPSASSISSSTIPSYAILTHITPLPSRRAPPIKLRIQGAPRQNASAKDSEWVKQRTALEAAKPSDVEEIILVDETGNILEGTQTNIFLVMSNNTLYTAPIGQVLGGTVRRLVMEICQRDNITVIEEALNLTALRSNDENNEKRSNDQPYVIGAFITSTSRLVLPVDEISWPSHLHPHSTASITIAVTNQRTASSSSASSARTSSTAWIPLPTPDKVCTFTPRNTTLIQRIETLVENEIAKHSGSVLQ